MAAPTVVNVGAVASGTTITPAYPASIAQNDILIGIAESVGNEGYTPPAGWAHVTGSPVNIDTTTRLTVLWHRQGNGSASGDVTASWGAAINHAVGRIIAIRGCPTTGNPWDATPTTAQDQSGTTTVTWPSLVTAVADTLILFCIATGRDVASTANLGALAGGTGLSAFTERMDNWVSTGAGGGIGMATATKTLTGTSGTPTAVMGTNEPKALMTLAMAPLVTGTNFTANPADNAGATDSARLDKGEAAADTAAGSDAAGVVLAYVLAPADTAAGSDAASSSLTSAFVAGITDGAGASDSATVLLTLVRAAADTAAASDSASAAAQFVVAPADSAGVYDTSGPQRITLTELPASSAGATDQSSQSQTGGLVADLADTAAGSDVATTLRSTLNNPADSAAGSDAAVPVQGRTPADTAAGSDAALIDRTAAATDAAGAADSVQADLGRTLAPSDVAGATDAAVAATEKAPADQAGATDAASAVQANVRGPADVATGTDLAQVDLSGSSTQSLSDTTGAADAVSTVMARIVTVDDLLGLVDGYTRVTGFGQTPADAASGSDAAAFTAARVYTIADLAGATDVATLPPGYGIGSARHQVSASNRPGRALVSSGRTGRALVSSGSSGRG